MNFISKPVCYRLSQSDVFIQRHHKPGDAVCTYLIYCCLLLSVLWRTYLSYQCSINYTWGCLEHNFVSEILTAATVVFYIEEATWVTYICMQMHMILQYCSRTHSISWSVCIEFYWLVMIMIQLNPERTLRVLLGSLFCAEILFRGKSSNK